MKIKLLQSVGGWLMVGSIHNATINERPYHKDAPKWFVDGVGIYAYEAEELQECGHPVSSIANDDDGTCYCRECEAESALPHTPLETLLPFP